MSPQPLVSIITPTLNMGSRLFRCIASIKAQTYGSIEHVIIDACSTDDTVTLLESTPGLRWISEPDRGQSDAINKGLRLASGDILGWLNADDELHPDALRQVVAASALQPDAGLFYGDIELVEDGIARRVKPSPTFSFENMWRGNNISQPGTFWTRAAHECVGELDEAFHLTMDYEFWLRLGKAGVAGVYIPEVLARFEVHDASKTGTAGALAFVQEEAAALRKHGEFHGAATAIDRWYWGDVAHRVGAAAANGRRSDAAELAAAASRRLPPRPNKVRWFLWLARRSPRAAGWVYRRFPPAADGPAS